MSDEQTQDARGGGEQNGQQGQDNTAPGPVPYERFKAINEEKKKLEADMAALKAQLENQQHAGKTELEKLTANFDALKTQLEQERQGRIRLEVATRNGIPADLASRLTGTTAEELEADAARLKAYLKPAEGPGNPLPKKPGESKPLGFDLEGKSPEEIRKAFADGKVKLSG